ncbi:hypothetical protein ER308_03540 [Egibacter rhizosphaerae]|uniref:Cardiolipin synthase N-terminal domain-containing protein n=1 Tax=Egibacter rhizosphaerae TaxID=1670831 RepID=A0A411YC12_9ACTN|nr:hypothetical protein [Egibacter rhizosphaerae]QBI18715.1 hypothetical protein ER308_03540 [Egibacter rhizosphaerae]
MSKQTQRWSDLEPRQRKMIVAVSLISNVLQAIMLWDLWRRPASQIRGSKRSWVAASFVRPLGQIAYVVWGLRRDE